MCEAACRESPVGVLLDLGAVREDALSAIALAAAGDLGAPRLAGPGIAARPHTIGGHLGSSVRARLLAARVRRGGRRWLRRAATALAVAGDLRAPHLAGPGLAARPHTIGGHLGSLVGARLLAARVRR